MKKKIAIAMAILAASAAIVGFTNKPDGNVYEFIGNDYDIADNRVTVYFDKDF